MENMANTGWLQVGTLFVGMLGLGLASLVYLTRQFNRLADRVGNLEQGQVRLEGRFDRMDDRFNRLEEDLSQLRGEVSQLRGEVKSLGEGLQNVEKEQARMLGFLEGRGVMGKMPAPDVEVVS